MADQRSFEGIDDELEDLSRLDAKGLARRWRTLIGGVLPAGLGHALTLRVLAYHLQAQRHGDLDRVSRQALSDSVARPTERAMRQGGTSAPLASNGGAEGLRLPRPGTVLTREHGGTLHRVMVMENGFCWNGRVYDSLSKVAFAITGTRWNGPRFFGLRDRSKVARANGGNPAWGALSGCSSTASDRAAPS